MKLPIIILMVFTLSALLIISNNNLYLSDEKASKSFLNLYLKWLDQFYQNSQITLKNTITLDWFPG